MEDPGVRKIWDGIVLHHESQRDAERRVREAVRHNVGNDMTAAGLREAMRCHTFDGYRQDILKDGASPIAIAARAG